MNVHEELINVTSMLNVRMYRVYSHAVATKDLLEVASTAVSYSELFMTYHIIGVCITTSL